MLGQIKVFRESSDLQTEALDFAHDDSMTEVPEQIVMMARNVVQCYVRRHPACNGSAEGMSAESGKRLDGPFRFRAIS